MVFHGDRLSHAYIAAGRSADDLAMAVVCSGREKKPCMSCSHCAKSSRGIHPDILYIEKPKDKREVLIEQVRELIRDAIIVPNEADKKAYVISDAAAMNANAQNAILRILEEPPSHAVIILKTDTPDELLDTVRSRCIEFKAVVNDIAPVFDDDSTIMANDFFSAIQSGNASLVGFMYKLEKLDKVQFARFIEAARAFAVMALKSSVTNGNTAPPGVMLSHIEHILVKAAEFLDFNVSTGHISGMICASLLKGD